MSEEIYRELELALPSENTLPFVQVLDEGLALPELSGYYEVLYDESREQATDDRIPDEAARLPESWAVIVLYFPIHAELASAQIELVLEALSLHEYRLREKRIERQDYLEAYKQYYEPFQIAPRLLVVPSWDRGSERERELMTRITALAGVPDAAGSQSPKSLQSLYLDPGLAFGTGKHPTTELCLQYLDERFQSATPPRELIDAGAGSGILALGALLYGAERVYAFDIDGNAAIACEQNLRLNPEIRGTLTFERGGFDLPGLAAEPADLLVGNVTAAILMQNRKFINQTRAARMALSGILTEQQDEVIAAFRESERGWQLTENGVREKEGWVLIEFTASDSPA